MKIRIEAVRINSKGRAAVQIRLQNGDRGTLIALGVSDELIIEEDRVSVAWLVGMTQPVPLHPVPAERSR